MSILVHEAKHDHRYVTLKLWTSSFLQSDIPEKSSFSDVAMDHPVFKLPVPWKPFTVHSNKRNPVKASVSCMHLLSHTAVDMILSIFATCSSSLSKRVWARNDWRLYHTTLPLMAWWSHSFLHSWWHNNIGLWWRLCKSQNRKNWEWAQMHWRWHMGTESYSMLG